MPCKMKQNAKLSRSNHSRVRSMQHREKHTIRTISTLFFLTRNLSILNFILILSTTLIPFRVPPPTARLRQASIVAFRKLLRFITSLERDVNLIKSALALRHRSHDHLAARSRNARLQFRQDAVIQRSGTACYADAHEAFSSDLILEDVYRSPREVLPLLFGSALRERLLGFEDDGEGVAFFGGEA